MATNDPKKYMNVTLNPGKVLQTKLKIPPLSVLDTLRILLNVLTFFCDSEEILGQPNILFDLNRKSI